MNNKPTIIETFNICVEKYATNPFLWEKTGDKFLPTTYQETQAQACRIAAGLLQLGVVPSHVRKTNLSILLAVLLLVLSISLSYVQYFSRCR